MNYTKNHHLPQWEEKDRILRGDFNDAMANIETGLNQTAEGAAQATAEAAGKAQATADEALEKAKTAFSPSNMPYTVGSYTGNGSTVTVRLGFRPRFVIVTAQYQMSGASGMSCPTAFLLFGEGMTENSAAAILDNGFSVKTITSTGDWGTSETYPYANSSGRRYAYIAFR